MALQTEKPMDLQTNSKSLTVCGLQKCVDDCETQQNIKDTNVAVETVFICSEEERQEDIKKVRGNKLHMGTKERQCLNKCIPGLWVPALQEKDKFTADSDI